MFKVKDRQYGDRELGRIRNSVGEKMSDLRAQATLVTKLWEAKTEDWLSCFVISEWGGQPFHLTEANWAT